ncbi:hypothetical protein RFI_22502 [Reticulomyxa filosa]|uniref:Uncharacterized protein n=1 Tax=Reticulomyxa filosa TaxID=46433 RepID=X6MMM6_RETFI|nr:hypothetical protein RFI_22502 [Reticulomyxa filosa]|eukprot:ETO14866.1 hypothetical protein RFI_22502 [Reticulomyxa filosa]
MIFKVQPETSDVILFWNKSTFHYSLFLAMASNQSQILPRPPIRIDEGRQIVIASRPKQAASPTANMFSVAPIPSSVLKKCNNLQPDEVLFTPLYFSVDPYLIRYFFTLWKQIPFSIAVTEVLASRSKEYPNGQRYLFREFPWTTVHVSTKTELDRLVKGGSLMPIPKESPPYDKFSPSEYLGALGLTGQTAYYGLLTTGAFKDGENLFVSGAAG